MPSTRSTNHKLDLRQIALGCAVIGLAGNLPVNAQDYPGAINSSESTTTRNPLIQGANYTPANTAPQPGQAPPIGNGATPVPEIQGMSGSASLQNWVLNIPADQIDATNSSVTLPVGPSDTSAPGALNSQLAPDIPAPPSTPGSDPGILAPNPSNNYTPPATVTNINAQGGIQGTAPITKWNGQTTRDLGLPRTKGSLTTDFGQDIDTLSSVTDRSITRSDTWDGPRPLNGDPLGPNNPGSAPLLTGAQQTQDLYGDRTLFKGANLRAQMTIAPY